MRKVVRAELGQGSGRGAPCVPGQASHRRQGWWQKGTEGRQGHDSQAQRHRGRAGREAACRDCHGKQTTTGAAASEASWGAVGVTGPGAPTRGCVRGAWTLGAACAPRCPGPWCRGRGGAEAGGSGEATGSWSQSHGAESLPLLGRFCPSSHPLAFQLGPHGRAPPPTICCPFCQCWGSSVASVSP